MKSQFLKAISKSYIDRWNTLSKDCNEVCLKRKLIQFEWCKYGDQFQVGILFCIQNLNNDIEYPEYNAKHAHIWVDLGFKCLEISIMDFKNFSWKEISE